MPLEDYFVGSVFIFLAMFAAWLLIAVLRALFGVLAPIFFGIMWMILSVALGIVVVALIIYCIVLGIVLVYRRME